MKIKVNSETGPLKSVILGIASDRGPISFANNPKHQEIAQKGGEPKNASLVEEVESFARLLENQGVEVLRPKNIPDQDQIFCRDIGFGIGEAFIPARMRIDNRLPEVEAIGSYISQMSQVYCPPQESYIEGGDVIVGSDHVFVGLGDRTNQAGANFLEKILSDKEVISLPLKVTEEGFSNILHLDCAFQPVGDRYAILYTEGFTEFPEPLYDIYGEENLIQVAAREMYHMFPNIFSIHPELVVIEQSFTRLEQELEKRGIHCLKVDYQEVSKLGGLLRCSTCPLYREDY